MSGSVSSESSSSSSRGSRNPTPQEQLAERRARMKRKAEEELQASLPQVVGNVGCTMPSPNRDLKGKSREQLPAPPLDVMNVNNEAPVPQATELDLDMLLDGLGIDESIKQMAKDDKIFREDLIRQLMTIPIAGSQDGQFEQGFDLDDSDEEGDLGEYEFNQTIFCQFSFLQLLRLVDGIMG